MPLPQGPKNVQNFLESDFATSELSMQFSIGELLLFLNISKVHVVLTIILVLFIFNNNIGSTARSSRLGF